MELRWMALTLRIGTDPLMRLKNPVWLADDLSFAKTTVTWEEETCVLAFLTPKTQQVAAGNSIQLPIRRAEIPPKRLRIY